MSVSRELRSEDWLQAFERAGESVLLAVRPLFGTQAGREEHGVGAGGDRTVELDRRAEEVAIAEFEALHAAGARFSLLSEERGLVDLGAEYPRVLIDPVDGSRNAKRGLPVVAVMLALAAGPAVADVSLGWTRNLVSGERWYAIRGGGAYLDGHRLEPMRAVEGARIEVLSLETSPRDVFLARPLVERAIKLRMFGSMALSLAHTAAGGVDVHCSPVAGRVFDITAGVLMIEEAGGVATDVHGHSLAGLGADLESRATLLASVHPDLHRLALRLLHG